MKSKFSVIILAGGQGLRMKSKHPKVLHPLAGKPMIEHLISTVRKLNVSSIVLVQGYKGEQLKSALAHHSDLHWAIQRSQEGTGHAALQALPLIPNVDKILILCGDAPLIQTKTLMQFLELCQQSDIGLITAKCNPPNGFGKIIRDKQGKVLRIVEEKDASEAEKAITEINTGIFCVSKNKLSEWLPKLNNQNAKKEYYLTDIVEMAIREGQEITTLTLENSFETLGVNDKQELAALERYYQKQQAIELMQQGVTLLDPDRLDIRGSLKVGQDVIIDANVLFEGDVILEDDVTIGPNVVIKNAVINKGAKILSHCVIEDARIGENACIGPFARLRPGSELAHDVKIGNFVEIKNSKIGKNSKINHLSYVGDATVGQNVNIGAGTITCNYDGKNKHQTIIGDGAFIGSDTQLIAPVTIGEYVTIGAGTTVVKDVPAYHLIHNLIKHRRVSKEE